MVSLTTTDYEQSKTEVYGKPSYSLHYFQRIAMSQNTHAFYLEY